jgi:hypothetical protein
MSDDRESPAPPRGNVGDWWSRRFGGRGILQLVVGSDALFLAVVIAVCTTAYVIAVGERETPGTFTDFLFVAVGLYFLFQLVSLWVGRQRP